jgi:hypothetical protein
MAITTLDGALAGMVPSQDFTKAATPTLVVGRPHSLFYLGGSPGAGSAPGASLTGAVVNSPTAGQLAFTNPGAGNSYLARFQAQGTTAGTLMLCDRIWANGGINATTSPGAQTFTSSVQIGNRDINGSNAGVGVYAAVEVSGATGAGTPTLTLGYTNSGGTGSRTATNTDATVATSAVGSFYRIGLQAGDVGIQKADSLALSATWTSGTIHVILYRVLARLELTTANVGNSVDALTAGFPRLYDNSVPFLVFLPSATTASIISGHAIWTQG